MQDPIMAQFPLVLAIEPKLLPYAISNGFSMDYKVRDGPSNYVMDIDIPYRLSTVPRLRLPEDV